MQSSSAPRKHIDLAEACRTLWIEPERPTTDQNGLDPDILDDRRDAIKDLNDWQGLWESYMDPRSCRNSYSRQQWGSFVCRFKRCSRIYRKLGEMEIAQDQYRVWAKETFGSAEYLFAREWEAYYTYEEQEKMREVLTEEHVAQITSSRRSENIGRQDNEEDLADEGTSEDQERELNKATENIKLVLFLTQVMEKERMQNLDHEKFRFLV